MGAGGVVRKALDEFLAGNEGEAMKWYGVASEVSR